jgi:3-dehydroquinate synthase
VTGTLRAAGLAVLPLPVPDGEAAKTLAVAGDCWDALGAAGFTRSDAVVGLGGGATTDLAGWVAAAWLRGCRVVHLPTTLLGMVDAAVGGKTGIDVAAGQEPGRRVPPAGRRALRPDRAGHLPPADYRAGLAEVVKCGFIADPAILDLLERRRGGGAGRPELVERAVRVQGRGGRPGPAGERRARSTSTTATRWRTRSRRRERYRVRHGDAVAVGLVFARRARPGRPAGWTLSPPTGNRRAGRARPPGRLRPARLAGAARGDAGGQEGPRRGAPVRRAGRAGPAGDPGRPRSRSCWPRPGQAVASDGGAPGRLAG